MYYTRGRVDNNNLTLEFRYYTYSENLAVNHDGNLVSNFKCD